MRELQVVTTWRYTHSRAHFRYFLQVTFCDQESIRSQEVDGLTPRRDRIQFWNQFQLQIREFDIRGRTPDVTYSRKFFEMFPITHFGAILTAFRRLTQSCWGRLTLCVTSPFRHRSVRMICVHTVVFKSRSRTAQDRRPAIISVKYTTHCHGMHFPLFVNYPLSYGVPVRERYGSTLLPATREQHDQNCTQSH